MEEETERDEEKTREKKSKRQICRERKEKQRLRRNEIEGQQESLGGLWAHPQGHLFTSIAPNPGPNPSHQQGFEGAFHSISITLSYRQGHGGL